MSNTYYISDTHFGHDNILKFEPEARPFGTIEEHDEHLIDNWNSIVGKRDTIIHLGDVAFKPATTLMRVMPRLNGHKKLILGNHDSAPLKNYMAYFKVLPGLVKHDVLFSHYPVHPSQLEYRYKHNVHGHLHGKTVDDDRYINISCEHTDLKPIHQDELFEIVKRRKENER